MFVRNVFSVVLLLIAVCFLGFNLLPDPILNDISSTVPSIRADDAMLPVCRVGYVYDGDSLKLRCADKEEEVRLYCIDAPEMAQQPWGKNAREHLSAMLGEAVRLEAIERDRYGRTIARLRSQGDDVAEKLLKEGLAVVYERYCPESEAYYYRSQEIAKQRGKNVWGQAGLDTMPWVWRRQQE